MFIAMELNEIIETSQSINIYKDGNLEVCYPNDNGYNQIIEGWRNMTENAHDMPAFGVSLNNETVSAKNSGLWVEFVFESCRIHNEMPFEKLLVSVQKKSSGFNIIRYNSNDGYSGRCFYYDLVNRDTAHFYDILMNL